MPKRNLLLLIVISSIIRCIVAIAVPLGNDEVYYVLYGRFPEIHYYDHPLLIGWAIKLCTFNFYFEYPFFYRLQGIILSIPSTIFVYKTAKCIQNARAGWVAACLFTASFYVSLLGGVFAMPDSVQLVFWTGSVYFATLLFFKIDLNLQTRLNLFLWFGLFVGAGLLAKYHSIFLWFGMLGYVISKKREYLLTWQLWSGFILTCLFTAPFLYWNYTNDWTGFNFYKSRVGIENTFRFDLFFREFIGEIFYQNPIVWVFIILFSFLTQASWAKRDAKILLYWMSIPLLICLWGVSFFRETLPHWSGPAYISLSILASVIAVEKKSILYIGRWIKTSFSFILFVIISGYLLICFYPGTIGIKYPLTKYGSNDFTLDMYGWDISGKAIAVFLKNAKLDSLPLVSPSWFPAAHLDEYVTHNTKNVLYGVGSVEQIHQYKWINTKRGGIPRADSMLYIVPSNYYKEPRHLFDTYFKKINLVGQIPEYRSGELTRYFFIYLLSDNIKAF